MARDPDPRLAIERRTFLGLGLGSAAAWLVGCGDEAASETQGGSSSSTGTTGVDMSSSGPADDTAASSSAGAGADTTGADTSSGTAADTGTETETDTGTEACEPAGRVIAFDPAAIAQDDASFPLAVMAGEMLPESVMFAVWIPDAQPKLLRLWIPADAGNVTLVAEQQVVPDADGFVKVTVDGLCPGTWYEYGYFVEQDGELVGRSTLGRVRTAIAADAIEPLVIAMASCNGDAGGSYTWGALDVMADEYFDVFLHLGDMAYNDGLFSLEEYRANWRQYLGSDGYKRAYAAAGLYATWDDHEIDDNSGFDPRSMDPMDLERRANAMTAYFEALPIDGSARDFRLWRSFRWGLTAEIIVLDCRYERRASQGLYMSQTQMDFLKQRLSESPCHFKVVMNSVPITNMPLLWDLAAFDRWEGFPAQRAELLGHIDANQIDNVWFLSGDFHVCFVSRLEPAGDALSARTREIACTTGNTNVLGDLLPAGQFDYRSSQPRGVILMFDPEANAVNVRFIDPDTGEDVYDESLTQG